METEKVKFGLAQHFAKSQWRTDPYYFNICMEVAKRDLTLHGPTVKNAFKNIIAFLESVHIRSANECEKTYRSILEDDPLNLNALSGLSECTPVSSRKKDCIDRINKIMHSDDRARAIPKALLEIGLALCQLIPRYFSEDNLPTDTQHIAFDSSVKEYENVYFETEAAAMEMDLYTDCNIAQKKRVYGALRYLQEGLCRFSKVQTDSDKTDILVWKFFLAKTYNRLSNWISYTRGEIKLRKTFSLKSLELLCEVLLELDQNGDKHQRMYAQRCLVYIGQVLITRKDNLLLRDENELYIPDCFNSPYFHNIWENPTEAFDQALRIGYDAVVYTRNAKRLVHEKKFDAAIEHINNVFDRDKSTHWYAASIRMSAFRLKHKENCLNARKNGDFSTLTYDDLLKAEEDGKYCYDTYATQNDLAEYAATLRWLGKSLDGIKVVDKNKIHDALIVLERMYKEQGCHTNIKVHKIRAECHADLDEIDDAIKYIRWSLNSYRDSNKKPSFAFSMLIDYLFRKLENTVEQQERNGILKEIKFYIDSEVKRCHDLIRNADQQYDKPVADILAKLLNEYNKKDLDQAESIINSKNLKPFDKQRKDIEDLKFRYDFIFKSIRSWCRNHPNEVKQLLDFIATLTPGTSVPTMVKMSLICLGGSHREWTQGFNRRRKNNRSIGMETDLALFTPSQESFQSDGRYDFLLIHAPDDKEWVNYTLLPEMEDRPKEFKGLYSGDDFKSSSCTHKDGSSYLLFLLIK